MVIAGRCFTRMARSTMLRYSSHLIFGTNDARESFKHSSESGIARMYTERHISGADNRYWVQYTTIFNSTEDVFSTLSVQDLRRVAKDAPENLVTLVDVLTLHLESLVNDPNFAPVPPKNLGGWEALFSSTAPQRPVDQRNRGQEALNCCRVLSRVIPVIYESEPAERSDTDIVNLEQSALWSNKTRSMRMRASSNTRQSVVRPDSKNSNDANPNEEQFILTDGDESTLDPLADPMTDAESIPSTGYILILTLMELLFHSGFTMPWTEEQFVAAGSSDISRVHFTIWEAGIGSPMDLEHTTQEHIQCRTEIMRLLLVLLSKPMYVPAHMLSTTPMQALDFVTCELERPVVLSFLCSLLNTVANYRQADAWKLFGTDVTRDTYTSLCLEMLCALLSHRPDSNENLFEFYAKKLYRESDFLFLINGSRKMFRSSMAVTNGPFEMGSSRATFIKPAQEHVSEMLVVFWTLLRSNKKLREVITQSPGISFDFLSWLLYVSLANKSNPATLGQAQLAIFLLQDLSIHKDFAKCLSKPNSAENITVPVRLLRRQGTLALDVLIESIYLLITTSSGQLSNVYPSLLLILYNTSPYWQRMSVASASRLEQLLHHFASFRFLLSDANHPYLLGLLLDSCSRAIQFNANSNGHLIYVLVRSAHIIERTRTFDLDSALVTIQFARDHYGNNSISNTNETPEAVEKPGPVGLQHQVDLNRPLPPISPDENPSDGGKIAEQEHLSENAGEAKQNREHSTEQEFGSKTDKHPLNGSATLQCETNELQDLDSFTFESEPTKADLNSIDNNNSKNMRATDITKPALSEMKDVDAQASDCSESTSLEQKSEEISKEENQQEESLFSEEEVGLKTRQENPPPVPPKATESYSREQLDQIASTVGKHGFVPTQEWVNTWLSKLSFDVLKPMLAYLVPRMNEFCASPPVMNSAAAHEQVLAFLRDQPLSEVIPSAPEPQACSLEWTDQNSVWFQSYVWGLIYAVGVTPFAIWYETHTHLFEIHVEQPAESAVSKAVHAFSLLTSSLLSQTPFSWSQSSSSPDSAESSRDKSSP